MSGQLDQRFIVVAQFAGSHGVRGEFKLRSFTDEPRALFTYGPLTAPDGKTLTPSLVREVKPGLFLCRDAAITTPEACAVFKGALFSVSRDVLPATEDDDDFYIEDLIGLEARTVDGERLGKVRGVPNYGAGDIIDIQSSSGAVLVPFTRDAVPEINLSEGFLSVVLPEEEEGEAED